MYIDPRFDDPHFGIEKRASYLAKKRPAQEAPIPRLESFEAFGAQLRRHLAASERPVVMAVGVDTQATGAARVELLTAFGSRLRSRVRTTDLVVRVGDQFGVFLLGDAAPHAAMIRERLRVTLQGDYGFGPAKLMVAQPRFGVMAHPGKAISGVELVLGAVREMGGCRPPMDTRLAMQSASP